MCHNLIPTAVHFSQNAAHLKLVRFPLSQVPLTRFPQRNPPDLRPIPLPHCPRVQPSLPCAHDHLWPNVLFVILHWNVEIYKEEQLLLQTKCGFAMSPAPGVSQSHWSRYRIFYSFNVHKILFPLYFLYILGYDTSSNMIFKVMLCKRAANYIDRTNMSWGQKLGRWIIILVKTKKNTQMTNLTSLQNWQKCG